MSKRLLRLFVSLVLEALVRLPLATALGAALALRPRRRGTPPRDPAVIQTQIIPAILELDPERHGAIEWSEKPKAT